VQGSGQDASLCLARGVGGSPPRDINGKSAADRLSIRQQLSAPLVDELENWMRQERAGFSRHNEVAQSMDYMLKRWQAFTRFLHDGRICLSNNAAGTSAQRDRSGQEGTVVRRFGSGGQRATTMYDSQNE
jgi:transposase